MVQVGLGGTTENPVSSQKDNTASTVEGSSLASKLAHSLAVILKPFRERQDKDIKSPKSSGPNLVGPGGEIISDSQASMPEKSASKEKEFDFPTPNETNSSKGSIRPEHWKFPNSEEIRNIKPAPNQSGDSTLSRHIEGEAARATTGPATFSDAPMENQGKFAALAQRNAATKVVGTPPSAGNDTVDGKTAAKILEKAAENARGDLEKLEKKQ